MNKTNTPHVLSILHLPPPIHGASVACKYIFDSRIINESFQIEYIRLTTATSLEDVGKGSIVKVWRFIMLMGSVFRSLMKKRFEFCYITLNSKGPGFFKDMFIVFLVRLFGVQTVFHFHNRGVSESSSAIRSLLYRLVFRRSKVILISELLFPDIQKYVSRSNVFICANGVPDIIEGDVAVQRVRTPVRLLFLSNMMEEKGVWILLEAVSVLRMRGVSDFRVDCVGAWADINQADFEIRVKQMQLDNCVFAHGSRYGEEKNAFLSNADVFVFPTYYHNEVAPLVILEAMRSSLPVISTTIGAIPDLVENGVSGLLVPPRDIGGLADNLEVLITSATTRSQYGRIGRQSFVSRFTITHFENRIRDIFSEVSSPNLSAKS